MTYNCVIVIPAYNPPASFAQYVPKLIEAGFDKVMMVLFCRNWKGWFS